MHRPFFAEREGKEPYRWGISLTLYINYIYNTHRNNEENIGKSKFPVIRLTCIFPTWIFEKSSYHPHDSLQRAEVSRPNIIFRWRPYRRAVEITVTEDNLC